MAFPLSPGSAPESAEVSEDQWTKICSGVNVAKISNLFDAEQQVYLTYVPEGADAPTGLNIEKWKMPAGYAQFKSGISPADIYIYPAETPAKVRVEA